MPTRPTQGGSAGTWGTELNAWLDVAHNSDGTLNTSGGGGSGAPLQADYLFTTDGTTITRYNRTGAVSATGTNLGALVNEIAANYICCAFSDGIFPWTTKMTLDTFIGMRLVGSGGLQNENKNSLGGRGGTQFKWTPASGTAFSAAGTQGLTAENISFQWTNGGYTVGDGTEDGLPFFSIEGIDHSTPTRHAFFQNCYFGAAGSGLLNCGGPAVDINKTVNVGFWNCLFAGGLMNVRAHHVNDTDDFANVVVFDTCRFSRYKAPTSVAAGFPSIYGSGNSWSFRTCHWEPSSTNPHFLAKIVIEKASGWTFEDCWVGDNAGTPPTDAAFIEFQGYGLRIVGGHWNLADGYSFVKALSSNCDAIVISGVDVLLPNAPVNGWLNVNGNGFHSVVIEGISNWPSTAALVSGNTTEPIKHNQIPYFSKTANYTLQQSDHERTLGVDATSGALTITLPAVSCVGCTFTIKKTDAGANSVTVQRAGSATIDGSTTYALAAQYKFVKLVSNGTNWMVVGSN